MLNKDKKCDYGCGNRARFTLKSGKGCCSPSINKCDGMRVKNSSAKKGKAPTPFALEMAHRARRGNPSWNSGLRKESDSRIEKLSNKLKDGIRNGRYPLIKNGHSVSNATKIRLSEVAKSRKFGGYQPGSGRGSKGWYKGFWCDSSWELAYVIYNLDHGIEFKRNLEKFEYEHQGVLKRWIPDFIDKDGYVEVKGYKTEQVEAKIKSFKKPLKLLMKDDLKEIFKYVIGKYGKDYIKLYDPTEK